MISQDQLLETLTEFAYEPLIVYSLIILLLTASSFGLPMPEEVTLISAGVLGYLGMNPAEFPPPYEGARPVHAGMLATVCFFAVFFSDLLVFWLGRNGRRWMRRFPRFEPFLESATFRKVEDLTLKHGAWMAGAFRFTPGLRFPGHFACGMLGLPMWKFILVDGFAALISVPTQVLLVSYYGEEILSSFKQFKLGLLAVIVVGAGIFLARKYGLSRKTTA